jgi:hypothetical protein
MSDTIKGAGDIYEKDLYGNLRKSGKSVIPIIDAINDGLKETAKINNKIIDVDPKDITNLNKINKGIDETNKAFEEKVQIDKERSILQDKINKQLKEENTSLEEAQANLDSLKKQRASLNKAEKAGLVNAKEANKQRAELNVLVKVANTNLVAQQKEVIGLTAVNKKLDGSYVKQSKELRALKTQYKNLRIETGKATDETDDMLKAINKLDKELKDVDESAGDFQRNVGDYPDTLGDATDSLLGFAAGAVAAKLSVDGLTEAMENTEEGSEALREATSGLGGIWDQASNAASSFVLDVVDLGKGLADGEVSAFGLAKSLGLASIGMSDADKSATSLDKSFSRTTDATENFAEKAKASAEAAILLEQRTIAYEKAIRPLEKRLTVLNGLIEEQQSIAGDGTRAFNELQTATLKGQELQIEAAGINVRIASEELALTRESIRIKNLAGGAGVELRNAEVEAVNKLIEAEDKLKLELLENDKELRQIKQDRVEKDLDIFIDGFDNQKTINEQIISNEKETLAKREQLFGATAKLADASFDAQRRALNELSKEEIDFDSLLSLDATALQEQIRLLGLSEVIEGRLLEVIRERRIVLQDKKVLQEELNAAEQEGLDLRKDIEAQEDALFKIITGNAEETTKALEDLEKQREQDNIDNLIRKLDLEKDGSIASLNIQKELNDALLDQQENRISKEQENEKAALEEEKKIAEQRRAIQDALLRALEKSLQKRSDAKIEDLDNQVDASEKNQDRLRELADKGSLDAEKSISIETKKQAELKRAKEKEERKQELVTAGFKIFGALLDQGKDPTAATLETAALLGALPAIIDAIPAFFDGTESTGTVAKPLDSNGGRLAMVHDNERIMTEKQNNKMGGVSNDEAANIIQKYNMGELYNHNQIGLDNGMLNSINLNGLNKGLERKMDALNESIKNIKIPETTVKADELRNMLVITKKVGSKVEIQRSKLH